MKLLRRSRAPQGSAQAPSMATGAARAPSIETGAARAPSIETGAVRAPSGEPAAAAISAKGLTRRFGDFVAVDGVDLEVPRGTIFAFLGANGSGKTTTIRMLIGLLTPSAGEITVAGVDVLRHPRRVREAIGYMGQKVSLYQGLTLLENVEFYGGLHGITGAALAKRWGELRERFDLAGAEKRASDDLPAGLRQRAGLALATLHEPSVLFLDEPTAGVDLESRALFWDLIREHRREGVTVFVTTHFLDEADYCDHVSFIESGRIVVHSDPEGLRERYSDGYRAFCPVSPERRAASIAALGRAGWKVADAEDGLQVLAQRADAAMLATLRDAADPGRRSCLKVEQPSMSAVFARLLHEGARRRDALAPGSGDGGESGRRKQASVAEAALP